MSVFIRRFGRNSLVSHDKLVTGFLKKVANKLRTVVRTYDGFFCLVKELAFHKRFLRDLDEMLRFTRQSNVIRYYGAIKYVQDAHKEEEALLSANPAILYVSFPQLIRGRYDAIVGKPLGMLNLEFPLWTKHIHLLA
ncbi:Uncharacterised protein [Mycobacterium tuberculosis]|nr:Uncharacterised protein [Mycobacterium tuberculosis]